jgi:hypothetical protein
MRRLDHAGLKTLEQPLTGGDVNLDHLRRIIPAGLLVANLYGCGTRDARPDADAQVAEAQDTAPVEDVCTSSWWRRVSRAPVYEALASRRPPL